MKIYEIKGHPYVAINDKVYLLVEQNEFSDTPPVADEVPSIFDIAPLSEAGKRKYKKKPKKVIKKIVKEKRKRRTKAEMEEAKAIAKSMKGSPHGFALDDAEEESPEDLPEKALVDGIPDEDIKQRIKDCKAKGMNSAQVSKELRIGLGTINKFWFT